MDDQNIITWMERMQHDLRTPLTGMLGFAKRIQAETTDPVIKQYADQLVLATEALDTVLLFKPVHHHESTCLQSLCEKVVDLQRPAALLKKIQLTLEYNAAQSTFFLNAAVLFRILSETIANAIKFTEKGEVTLIVTISDNNMVQFEIRDTGIGIAKNHIDHIFDLHYRGENHQHIAGQGIGLSSVKEWVEALSGSINVISELGYGTSFFYAMVFIPDNQIATENVGCILQHPCTVLLIEDHEMTASINQQLLEKAGCDVDLAQTGRDAISRCSKKKYDIVFLDLHLPDMSSQDVIDAINAMTHQQPEMVGLTAYHMQQDSALKIHLIYQKPLKLADIIALLKNHREANMAHPIIDLKLGAERIRQDEKAARDMLRILVAELDLHKTTMHHAMASGDYAKLQDVVHKLLGGLAYCGAPRLEYMCGVLKDALVLLDSVEIKKAVKGVVFEMERLKEECR